MARIMYIGAVVIHASQPKELARWYSEKFGMPATFEHRGGFFGGFETAAGPVHIAIVPNPVVGGQAARSRPMDGSQAKQRMCELMLAGRNADMSAPIQY